MSQASARASLWRADAIGWSLYDFANTIYSMNIVSLYLKRYIVEDLGYGDQYFDIPFSVSMFLAAALLPALGVISDRSTKKKIFLFLFTLTCCSAVGLMALVPGWAIGATIVLFIIANFSYEAGQPFYNALLYSIADGKQARMLSGVGVALGYVGAIVGMLLVQPFVSGSMLAFDIPFMTGGGKTAAFLPTALLFLLFSIPVFLWVKERVVTVSTGSGVLAAYREVWQAIKDTRRYRGVLRFLVADYFVEDAVTTVILNIGIYCSLVLGMAEQEITIFLVISTATAVLGSFVFGYLAKTWSLRGCLRLVMIGWVVALVLFAVSDNPAVIWILGSAVGILLGGLWTTTRPYLAELVPRAELGKFFGLFSLSGRAAAMVGPLVWTLVVILFQPDARLGRLTAELLQLDSAAQGHLPYKAAILSLALMVLTGLIIFHKVPDAPGADHAA